MYLSDLSVNAMAEPIGIAAESIRFSWILNSDEQGVKQESYQILVEDGQQPIWNSGRLCSEETLGILYQGPKLGSNRSYKWTVEVSDNTGASAKESSFFRTAIPSEELKAKWIEPELPPIEEEPIDNIVDSLLQLKKVKEPEEKLTPSTFFRKEFELKREIRSAFLYMSAHGVYHAEINGTKVDDRVLAPEFTSYHNRTLYQVYDVTDLVRNGNNAVGVIVADGWWGGRINVTGTSCTYGNMHGLFLQLEVEYRDGGAESVYSDEAFRCAQGPYVFSDIFIGEKYDANLEMEGWSSPGFDTAGWKAVHEADYDTAVLKPQMFPPVRCVKTIPVKKIFMTPKGEIILDFGQNMAGTVTMRVEAPKGTEISMQHMEELDKDGNFFINIHGSNKQQKDIYICKGGGEETYTPRFTFHGFRYVKLTGYPGTPGKENFRANVLASDNRNTGTFVCSNEKLNRLQSNIYWSQISNFISIPTDCPQRERSGYTGDMEVYAETSFFNQNNQAFLRSWLSTVMEEQCDTGAVQSYAPTNPKATADQGVAGWGDAMTIVPYEMYRNYGDIGILEECYDAMKRWVEHERLRARTKNSITVKLKPAYLFDAEYRRANRYLWNDGFHFGDWLIPSKTMSGPLGMLSSVLFGREAFVSGYYANSVRIMGEIAKILGREEDAQFYEGELENIRKAFRYVYLNKKGRPKTNYQGIHAMILAFDLVSEDQKPTIVENLVRLIHENDGRIDTGFLSVNLIMDALWNNGKKKEAYGLLYQEKCPSWLYEVNQGATTMWEKWNTIRPDGTRQQVSYNHYAFGCVGRFMYQHILGIQNIGIAYDRIRICPEPDETLTFAKGSYKSVRGMIEVEWKKENEKFWMQVQIPCGTEAVIVLPNGDTFSRGSGKYDFSCQTG